MEEAEKKEIVTEILKKSFKIQSNRWTRCGKLITNLEGINGKKAKHKNLEKELSENRLLLGKLSGFSQTNENVINRDALQKE
jgi:hypothetical protein